MKYAILAVVLVALFGFNLSWGSVSIPLADTLGILLGQEGAKDSWSYIIIESRLPQAVAALLAGSSLAVCGLLLQTAFRNPLADPSVFGINSGAGLGVALVTLASGGSIATDGYSLSGFSAVMAGALMGAMAVMGVIYFFSTRVRSSILLLVIGIMVGYVTSSAVTLLNFFATDEGVKSFMVWSMAGFGSVSIGELPFFASVTIIGLLGALLLIKPLNALLLGEQYAENLGINVVRVRNGLLLCTGILTASTTAFCGPISFIGLAVPHLSRLLLRTDNHRTLLPMSMLIGGIVGMLCSALCTLPADLGLIPLNAVTPIIGAPVIVYVIMRHRQ